MLVLLDLNVITLLYSSMDQILSFSPPSQKLSWLYFLSLFIQVACKSFVRVHLICFCYCFSVTKPCPTLCDSMDCYGVHQPSLSVNISQNLLPFMSIESVMPSNHLVLCRPPLLLPPIFPSIRVFSNELALHIRWPKFWSFSISSSSEYSELISFRIDWLDLLAVQGTLKSLLQHHSSKASILWLSTLFMIQLSHWYMINGKTISLTIWTLVGKVMDVSTLSHL